MDATNGENTAVELMSTLPGDDVRQIMWRFADRYDIQMVVQSARSVARGLVARLVAEGARNSHEWTDNKAQLLTGFDEVGLTTVFMDPEEGGFMSGPKNLTLALSLRERGLLAEDCCESAFLMTWPIFTGRV